MLGTSRATRATLRGGGRAGRLLRRARLSTAVAREVAVPVAFADRYTLPQGGKLRV